MNQIFNFPGDPAISNWLLCAVYLCLITGGYAIGVSWLKHYLNSSESARMVGKLIGTLAGVIVAIYQTRILTQHFDNLTDETTSMVLIMFIIVNAFICIRFFTNSKRPTEKSDDIIK